MQKNEEEESIDVLFEKAVDAASKRLAKTVVVVILGLATGGGVYIGSGKFQSVVRPDPATGSELRLLQAQVDELENDLKAFWGIQQQVVTRLDHIESDDREMEKDIKEMMRNGR